MKQLRIGIVGSGGIARTHVRELQRLPGVEITAVVDLDRSRAEWLVAEGVAFHADVTHILEYIDAAVVTTPPRARVSIVNELARAGKAILCEKPIAGSWEDACDIEAVVHETGIPFMMGFMRRWHPPYQELKRAAGSEDLGRPLQFFRRRLGFLDIGEGNWRVSEGQRTGFTIESVSHDIDLLRWLGGDIVEARGEVVSSRGVDSDYDDMMVATLRFRSGALGMIQSAWSSLVSDNAVGVLGTGSAAAIEGQGMWRSEKLRVGNRDQQDVVARTFTEQEAEDPGYTGQARAFVSLARGEQVDHPGVADGVAALRASLDILESAAGVRK